MSEEQVILVNEQDEPRGLMAKMEAHEKGELHRAFSVFVFNSDHELILQQRALSKYHSPGLWANTCCSHPRDGEATIDAAHRRLVEEMGFDCEIKEWFSFVYNADVGQDLIEHEYDHVFIGQYDGEININPDEVDSYRFATLEEIAEEMDDDKDDYTIWFQIAFDRVREIVEKENPY